MQGLTEKQRRTLVFIRQYGIEHGGLMPTMRDVMRAFGLRQPSSVHQRIVALRRKGFLQEHERYIRLTEVGRGG